MTNETDIIIDNVYDDISSKLDTILKELAKEIQDEEGLSQSIVEKIIHIWCEGAGIRLSESD